MINRLPGIELPDFYFETRRPECRKNSCHVTHQMEKPARINAGLHAELD
jgi:hypothetical protein